MGEEGKKIQILCPSVPLKEKGAKIFFLWYNNMNLRDFFPLDHAAFYIITLKIYNIV